MLIIALLGGKRIEINGKLFLRIKNEPGKISYGTIEFVAPDVPGKYEIIGSVATSPFQASSDYYPSCEQSMPFTLIVK
jgi:hypothetical protein